MEDESWIQALKEELDQFERKGVLTLIERSKNWLVIGTKWVFCNKVNEDGKFIREKARLYLKITPNRKGLTTMKLLVP